MTNMSFDNASRFADKHDVVLVGYRGVDGSSARLPGGRRRRSGTRPTCSARSRSAADAGGLPRLRRPAPGRRRRPRRLHAAAAGRRPGGRPSGARLRAHRPAQRERRDAHGDDLRLALPGEHPPLGDDRRQPARPLSLGRRGRPTSRSPLRRALREGRRLPQPHGRPRRLAARDARELPDRWCFLPIKRGNVRQAAFFGLMERPPTARAALGPMTIDTLALRRKGDASGLWLLSLLAQVCVPERAGLGRHRRRRSQPMPPPPRHFFATHADGGSVLGNPGTDFIWGGGRLVDAWPANTGRERVHATCGLERRDAADRRRARLRDAAAGATKELLPHLPNGHQVVLPGVRPHGRLLGPGADGRQPADQHLLGHRPGGRRRSTGRQRSTSRPASLRARSPRSSLGAMVGLAR